MAVDGLRAGALALGSAGLLAMWAYAWASLEAFELSPARLILLGGMGLALASWLGFPTPAAKGRTILLRIATILAGVLAIVGVVWASKPLVLEPLDGTRYFGGILLATNAALVGAGLRRFPATRAGRLGLGVPVALLIVTGTLAVLWPTGMHPVIRRLRPLSPALVRATVASEGWGPLGEGGRTRIVDLATSIQYESINRFPQAHADVTLTLEVVRPFEVDSCGDVHEPHPQIPPWLHNHPTREDCLIDHPTTYDTYAEMRVRHPSPCCLFTLKEHHPGERLSIQRSVPFELRGGTWICEICPPPSRRDR